MKKEVAIIYCYRDRDLERVKRSLDSLSEHAISSFEVIFVDYGSNVQFTLELRTLLDQFPFVNYIYNESRGWPWNRAHALNTGIKSACSDFIFTADVDLIFTDTFVETILECKKDNEATFFSIYLTPKLFNDWKNVLKYTDFKKTTPKGLGISLILKSALLECGGYDEFFSFWGYEDNELFNRLSSLGIVGRFLDEKIIAYHQWHGSYYDDEKAFPSGWRDFMKNCMRDRGGVRHDSSKQGLIFTVSDRPALLKISDGSDFMSLEGGVNFIRFKIAGLFSNLRSGDSIQCKFDETTYPSFSESRSVRIIRFMNKLLGAWDSVPFRIQSKFEDLHVSKYQVRDLLMYFVFENRDRIRDFAYEIDEPTSSIKFALIRK